MKAEKVLYLGTPEILKFTVLNSKEVYYVSPEKIEIKSSRLKKFVESPQDFDVSLLPKKLDRIVNFLPFNIVTSFKIMGKYLDLLEPDKNVLIKLQVPKKQAQYTEVMLHDLLAQFKISKLSYLNIEGYGYIIGKKL
ncbi:MAG: hypothetical protein DRP10_04135 [Candidatus Aenigmatarchaeota archaeon]|nr:MAG: hypothetical protein DRP10_04135 [Candidatus Aenigmarchaeota archaeon]